ncbi:ATP-binding cassette domain-containing protein [Knoellia sp. CPCC 206435]|uniref:ATP-binding cassette domain-containing protein n=1 Tax=Knoellia terrae TaxID=3404797 RepID=UPI003B42C5A1
MSTTVRFTGVTRRYGKGIALDDVDLSLQPGVTGLLGPNGAGKTTLLRLLATVLPPSEGRCRILGLDPDVPAERTEIRRGLGYLPQEAGYPRGFTAFQFVDYVAALKEWTDRSQRHAEVVRVLSLVGMQELAGKKMRRLSGGQRRRVALAQAFLGSPDLLVLDEPTNGLDPEQRASLRGVLSGAGQHSTVLLATHQTEDVAALCERVVVLDAGHVTYDGPVRDLVGQAAGRVWLADVESPHALSSWRVGTGRYRHVALEAPPGAELAEPTLEDAYLLLRGGRREGSEVTA